MIGNGKGNGAGIVEKIVGVETFALLSVLPLFFHNYYFDILPAKYMFYYISVLAALACTAAVTVWRAVRGELTPGALSWKSIREGFNEVDWAVLALLLSVTLSTVLSDYVYESFWGNEGRYNGMFLWLCYVAAYFLISRKLKWRPVYLELFLAAGMLACLFGISDFFRMDLLGFKQNLISTQRDIFVSTFGNINTYTAYVGMFLAVAIVLYIQDRDWKWMIWHYICVIVGIFALIMGKSDNAYLSMGAIWGFGPLYFFREKKGIRRYVITIATLFSSVWIISLICAALGDQVLQIDSLFRVIANFSMLPVVVAVLWVLAAACWLVPGIRGTGEAGSMPRRAWGIFLILIAAVVAFVLWDVNGAGHVERYGSLADYLVFSEAWGTYRGLAWKISMENFVDFPILQKIFGYGPDTFGIVTVNRNMGEMLSKRNEIFDSAHNEYIHYLFTIGIAGVTCYVAYLALTCRRMVRRAVDNPYVMACLFGVVSYAVQAAVNIASPLVTPVMMTLAAAAMAACRETGKERL